LPTPRIPVTARTTGALGPRFPQRGQQGLAGLKRVGLLRNIAHSHRPGHSFERRLHDLRLAVARSDLGLEALALELVLGSGGLDVAGGLRALRVGGLAPRLELRLTVGLLETALASEVLLAQQRARGSLRLADEARRWWSLGCLDSSRRRSPAG
jgi:hypothetical protein